ncbi:MAG TPA: LysR substrate-binding domain-containing protein, partial [Acidobacteriaceae bacterium]|nr:LysR substrate-binding domain-containing protein [Acidobacteriaceae bacterium]
KIGASHTIAVYLLPKILPHIVSEWPKLRLHILGGSTNEVLQALVTHQVSIGLIESPPFRPDLKTEIFGEDELALVVHPDHPWARKLAVRAAELVKGPILLREEGSGMRRLVEEYLERNGVLRQQLNASIDMNSTEGIVSAVEAGLGAGFVPCIALEKALRIGTVKKVELENGPVRRQFSIVLLNGPEPRGPAGQLLDLVRNYSRNGQRHS